MTCDSSLEGFKEKGEKNIWRWMRSKEDASLCNHSDLEAVGGGWSSPLKELKASISFVKSQAETVRKVFREKVGDV